MISGKGVHKYKVAGVSLMILSNLCDISHEKTKSVHLHMIFNSVEVGGDGEHPEPPPPPPPPPPHTHTPGSATVMRSKSPNKH